MRYLAFISLAIILPLSAKDKKLKSSPPDAIEVVAHIPIASGPVFRFLPTEHYSSHYLYAEHSSGSSVTLIDVTRPSQPAVLAEVAYPAGGSTDNLVVVSGTAAMVTSNGGPSQPQTPQTIRIFDFSDPKQPRLAKEFIGVTAISRDDRRGLIFLANGDGVWILHQNRADDPEIDKAYAHHVVYDH
jgi:hypothetical protein